MSRPGLTLVQQDTSRMAGPAASDSPAGSPGRQRVLRTVLIHQAYTSPNEAGGTRHYEFARRVVSQGHRFAIVGADASYLTGRQTSSKDFISHESRDGIDIFRAYTFKSLHRSFAWRIISFLSFASTSILAAFKAGKVDVVMGTTPPIFQAVSACLVAFCRRKPFLLEVRDLWPAFAIDMGVLKNPLLIAASRWLEHWLYRRAAHLLVNSPAYRDYLIGGGVPARKISFIPNGVDPAMFSPHGRGEEIRRSYDLAGKFVVTYGGALGLANDISTVLRTARKLQTDAAQVHFLLVGDGTWPREPFR